RIIGFNRFLWRHCAQRGLTLADTWSAFADASGNPRAGYLHADGRNLSYTGCYQLAASVAAVLPKQLEPWRHASEAVLEVNGDFVLDGNSDGLADGWSKSSTGTVTAVASLSAHESSGNWQKLAISGGSSASEVGRINTGNYAVAPGDIIDFALDVKTGASVGAGLSVRLNMLTSGYATTLNIYPIYTAGGNDIPIVMGNAVRVSGTGVAPATTAYARMYVELYGTAAADVSIGRLSVRKRVV
ncbi:MAG: hypothetical protein U1E29_05560, partial [Coriobacteriia bacterium]|nr:hypothetical protein [Coriobacteriia bacterium]